VPSCAEGGVIGVLPGIIGSLQALEVIKVISGVGETLSGRLYLFDALGFSNRTLKVRKDPRNPLNGENPTQTSLIDYEQFCGTGLEEKEYDEALPVKRLSVKELQQFRTEGTDHQLIDVREPYEYEIVNLGGNLIPQGEIEAHVEEISWDKPVILHCRTGIRSAKVIRKLESQYGFTNLYNLTGGVTAYANEIDTTLPVY
jgi:adenylyltransferase/sulfurtransferase